MILKIGKHLNGNEVQTSNARMRSTNSLSSFSYCLFVPLVLVWQPVIMTAYTKPPSEPVPPLTLKSKEERKKVLEEVARRRRMIYARFYQKQRLALKH